MSRLLASRSHDPVPRAAAAARSVTRPEHPLLRLQHAAGNHATQRLIQAARGQTSGAASSAAAIAPRWETRPGIVTTWQDHAPAQAPPPQPQRPQAAPPPTFTVEAPRVSAVQDGSDFNSPNTVGLFLGDFVMDARVRARAPTTGAFNDWEVGVVQMASGAIDRNCYMRPVRGRRLGTAPPAGTPVFVEQMSLPPGAFHPDRDPASAVFVDSAGMRDLGSAHAGRTDFTVPLHTEDHPRYQAWGFASAHTHNLDDRDVELVRHRHRGFFYTYVTARQKSTGSLHPLYTARWWLFADYRYFAPGMGIDFNSYDEDLTFRLIEHHAFSAADFLPVVRGDPMNVLGQRRRQGWGTECPGFVE